MQRTILVTGATSGIGRAICIGQLAEGRRVIGIGRDFSKFPEPGPGFTPVPLDLAELDQLPPKLKELTAAHPEVDTLILNAGRGLFGKLEQFSYQQIRDLIDLNFLSSVYLVRAFLPQMKRRGWGDIVLMGSDSALAGRRLGSVYGASKAALRSFAQALRREANVAGLRVTMVNPGLVKTEFFDGLMFEPGPDEANTIEPEDVAKVVATVLNLRPGTVVDEINLSPLKEVVRFRKSSPDE